VLALVLWFVSQSFLAHRPAPGGRVNDTVHALTAPLHQSLLDHPAAANAVLIVSSAFIDVFGLFLLATAIFGTTMRPFLGLILLFTLRQVFQFFIPLPPPEGMIWRYPGFPSLFVTYGTANDFFFSGHTAIAIYASAELVRLQRHPLAVVGFGVALLEAATVIVLRAHYTMDVVAGAATALLVALLVPRLAVPCDRALEKLCSHARTN
jgi:membrane-associated phospholipid phosphatase